MKATIVVNLDDGSMLEGVVELRPRGRAGRQTESQPHPATARPTTSERNLIQTKRPKNHSQTVAVLAFALAEAGTTEFTEEDIRRAYLRAGIRPPKVVSQAIRDAKNNFDFIEAGARRGTYRITNHGDRIVRFDLPNPE